jgi:hypothetical protein
LLATSSVLLIRDQSGINDSDQDHRNSTRVDGSRFSKSVSIARASL